MLSGFHLEVLYGYSCVISTLRGREVKLYPVIVVIIIIVVVIVIAKNSNSNSNSNSIFCGRSLQWRGDSPCSAASCAGSHFAHLSRNHFREVGACSSRGPG